jgi:hypothetical protein
MTTILNPTIQVSVAGVREIQTGIWYGTLTSQAISGNSTPQTIQILAGAGAFGSDAIFAILPDGIQLLEKTAVELILNATISDPSIGNKYLGIRFDVDPPASMRSFATFVNGYANLAYAGLAQSADTIRIVISSDALISLNAGTVTIRADLL